MLSGSKDPRTLFLLMMNLLKLINNNFVYTTCFEVKVAKTRFNILWVGICQNCFNGYL